MGRRLNIDHLSDKECEKILEVIQKDFELRQKEKQRLGQIEEKVEQEETKATILAEQKKFNANCCIRCCQPFGYIFNRRQLCQFCRFFVCKSCRTYFSEFRGYACHFCLQQRDLKRQSCEWFYSSVSRKFKRFGSAKVVRTFYKRKSFSDSELDSGYDPSQSNSLNFVSPNKSRPSVLGAFDHINNNPMNDTDNNTEQELPLPSTESLLREKPVSRATSLETLLPSSKERKSKSHNDSKKWKEHDDYSRSKKKVKDTRDIYKEAFESAKRAEEIKFKSKFDNLVNDFNKSLEKSAGSRTSFGSTSYGEVMTAFRGRVKDQLKNLSQRLQLAYESFDTPQTEDSICQKVRQNLSKLVEDILGESLDLVSKTSDEAVSDLSSLSDESGAEHNSFEDQIAQAVLSKILDNHRKVNGSSLPDVTDGQCIDDQEDSVHDSLEEEDGEIDDNSSELTKDFEDLKNFVRETTKRRTPSVRSYEEKVEVEEVIVPSVDYDRVEKKDNFDIRCSSLERVQRAEPPLPDFSDLENIDFSTYEVDPDLLSMNLAIIPEETEEDLDKVSKNEEDETQWRNNWIIKGSSSLSVYDNCGKKIGGEGQLFMTVPQPDDELVPRVGNEDADQLSDLSDTEKTDDVSDDETSFYAKTSEELARLSRKLSNTSIQTDSDFETKSRSSVDFDNFKRTLYRSDSDTTDNSGPIVDKSSSKLKYSEELIPAEGDDPKFLLTPESVTIQEGEPVKLSCRVTGTGDVDVFWYREDTEVEELEDSEDYEITNDGDRHYITMYNLKKSQAGQYMCIALNENGKTTQYFVINIKGNKQELKKPEFLKGIQDVEVHEGQSVKFRCKVKGYPQPRVTWQKDGKHFKNPINARIEKFGNRDYILTIDYATMDDDAEYSVVARNIAGEAKSTAQVIVEPAKSDEEMKSQATTPSTPTAMSPSKELSNKSENIHKQDDTRYHNGIDNISDKVLATKKDMTHVAEDMLDTANEFTYLNRHLDEMNMHLDEIENNMPSSDFTNNNLNIKLGDTTLLEAVANHQEMEKSAKSVRLLNSSALNILRTAEELINNEHQDSDSGSDVVTSTPRPSVSDWRDNDRNNETESFEATVDDFESVTSDVGASICADDISFQSFQTMSTNVSEDVNPIRKDEHIQEATDLTLDYTVPDYDPSLNMNDFSVRTQDNSDSAPNMTLNFGPKEIDRSRYQRDFHVEDKSKQKKHWDVKLHPFSPAAEIVNRKNGAEKTEEEIYLAAGKVYSLEDQVRKLEAKINDIDDNTAQSPRMAELEDEVARTAAQVSQREKEVSSIESAVSRLQLDSPVTSPRLLGVDNSSQHSPRHSIDSGFSSVRERERPQPVHIVGTTAEEEVPESRGEFDADSGIELPSVNRLRAMFSQQKRDDDFGDGNFTRVHSITARTLAKNKQAPDNTHNQQTSKSVAHVNLSSSQQDINANEKVNQVHLRHTVPNDSSNSAHPSLNFVPNLPNPPTYTDLEPGHNPVLIYPENQQEVAQAIQVKNVQEKSKPTSSQSQPLNSKDKKSNFQLDVKRATPKIRSGAISARAAFWEKRIETGIATNEDVDGEFPEMVKVPEN